MEQTVASLRTSFRLVPPAAVPAMLDCILSSISATPPSLLSHLLNEFHILKETMEKNEETTMIDSEWRNYMLSYVAAVCHLLKISGAHDMHMFVWKMLIPLLKLAHARDHELFNEVVCSFLDVVTETNSWEVLEATMVPFLLRSIGLSMGMFQNEELAIYKWSAKSTLQGSIDKEVNPKSVDDLHETFSEIYRCEDLVFSDSYDFPLSVSCNILALTLDVALRNKQKGVIPGPALVSGSLAKFFAGNVLWDLASLTLQMLVHSSEHRSSAIRFLLPFIFKAFVRVCSFEVAVNKTHHVLTRKEFFMKIWKCCKLLFSLGSLERRDAYDILSLYLSFSSTDENDDLNVDRSEETFGLTADQQFWDETRRGLLDKESLVRKQSLHILKTTLNLSKERQCYPEIMEKVSDGKGSDTHVLSKKGRWADKEAKSLGVGRMCNHTELSFSGQSRWEAFVFLYEMLEEFGTHLVEAAWNHQIMLWLQFLSPLENFVDSVNGEVHHYRMATAEQIFEWLAVLWERGFGHDNPQVRCIIMHSFLAIEWEGYGSCAKLVPKDFVLGPLIRGLNDPVHHREFGVKKIYSSWTIEAATRFMHHYASCMEGRQHISFLIDLSSVPKTHSLGRAGLMCLVECIAAAACGIVKHTNHGSVDAATNELIIESASNSTQNDRADLLDVLRSVVECSKQHFNPKYRHQVCEKILAAAAAVITATDVPLEILLHFISGLPHECTDYGGSLRHLIQKWLCDPDLKLLKAIDGFPRNFISFQHPPDSLFTFDDEELDAWGYEAKRWARALFLLVQEEQHFDPIIKFIQDHVGELCKQKNTLRWVVGKFLILVTSLVQELQLIQERAARYQVKTVKSDLHLPSMGGNLSFSLTFDKFAAVLFLFLEKLVEYTKLSCSIFGSAVIEDMTLPGSIRGKLGGPSQRRLSSSLCTSVLEAIISIRTLASVARWCTQYRTDVLINCIQTFLWDFCWNVIKSPIPKSEVQAEVSVAAYEACAYALKDLASMFSPMSMDLIIKNCSLPSFEEDQKALLDVFIGTFMHNISNVIDGGNLARTRRAILINWKWNCLESLLSLPNHALRNGVHLKSYKYYFSDAIIRQIFDDLVGSLENAGEASVLPMLRSVRMSMELFDSKRMHPVISSCSGISIEMMWLLVRSSWILHVSCNKRRVAPIAALLSSVLHYSVFGDERMHEFNHSSGPLKWFVEKVLEEGTKSPRTVRLAALHLSGLWLAYPNTLKYYMNELKLLTFYGSVAFDEDFEAELAENYDARNEVSMLSRSLDPELTDVFINTELYARVSVAVLFSKLADVADTDKSTAGNKDNHSVIASGKMFLLTLFDSVVNDKDLSKELYKKYSAIHRRKVRAWQMICTLSRFVDLDIAEQVTSSLHISIYRNNLPSVRQYMETFAIYIYLKFPFLVGQQLVPLLRNYDLRPQALSSYVFIAANVILHGNKETQFGHLDELLPPIIPLLTSHHHTLRGFTQILVYQILQKLLPDPDSSACASMFLERRCFLDLRSYLANNSDCARLRASMNSYLDSFDPVKSVSPAGIFANRVEELEFECVPTTLVDRVIDFLNDTREDFRSSMAKDAAAIKNESIYTSEDPKRSAISNSNGQESLSDQQRELSYDFQRKITFFKNEQQDSASGIFSDERTTYASLVGIESEDQLLDQLLHSRGVIVEKLKANRQQIVLLASLIDRIPNLAGLARTCEVFRAAGLAIADKNILNDKQFQLISVTAEKWVPIVEVPVASMKAFLERKKKEGYGILGLEQTANSVPLDRYKFPRKMVLVLGREKEGIPVEIIHMLDGCIEIPQLGVVRSLNVHVSGAIALWEYTRQHRVATT